MNSHAKVPHFLGPDWSRDFISDQAHEFLRVEQANGATTPSSRDNLLLERCTAHLMAICNCSRRTAETHAAQAIAELASRRSRVSFDMDRSTSHALFVVDRATNTTRVISAAELLQLLQHHESSQARAPVAA
ncbi:hypothetical protein [Bordetella sp. 2513F-2]